MMDHMARMPDTLRYTDDVDADPATPGSFLTTVRVASSTKDSINIRWYPTAEIAHHIHGYDVTYQATGSDVVQFTPTLSSDKQNFNIKHLHEDTAYNVCVRVLLNVTKDPQHDESSCVEATTRADSLHVALGSTLGAFLALAIIIGFVLLAKWQYGRQRRKRQLKHGGGCGGGGVGGMNGDALYHSRDLRDVDYDMSELSMQVNESHARNMSELDSQLDTIDDCCDDIDHVTAADGIRALTGGNLSDCSEDPLDASGYHVNQVGASPYSMRSSMERCHQRDIEQYSDTHSVRSQRSKYSTSRAKSVESSRSMLSRQFSIDSYGSAKRSPLRKQRSHDVGGRELVAQQSQDSGSLHVCSHPASCDLLPFATAMPCGSAQCINETIATNKAQLAAPISSTHTSRSVSPNFQIFCVQEAPDDAQTQAAQCVKNNEDNAPEDAASSSKINVEILADNKVEADDENGFEAVISKPFDVRSKDTFYSPLAATTPKSQEASVHNHIAQQPNDFIDNDTLECDDDVSEMSTIAPPVNDGGHTKGLRPNTSCPNW